MTVATSTKDLLILEYKTEKAVVLLCLGVIVVLWILTILFIFSPNDFTAFLVNTFFFGLASIFVLLNLTYRVNVRVDKQSNKITFTENRKVTVFSLQSLKSIRSDYLQNMYSAYTTANPKSSSTSKLVFIYNNQDQLVGMDSATIPFRPLRGMEFFARIHDEIGKKVADFLEVPFSKGKQDHTPPLIPRVP
jgi:hypothetical protein